MKVNDAMMLMTDLSMVLFLGQAFGWHRYPKDSGGADKYWFFPEEGQEPAGSADRSEPIGFFNPFDNPAHLEMLISHFELNIFRSGKNPLYMVGDSNDGLDGVRTKGTSLARAVVGHLLNKAYDDIEHPNIFINSALLPEVKRKLEFLDPSQIKEGREALVVFETRFQNEWRLGKHESA